MPVFACNPLLRSLQLVRDVQTFNFLIALHHRNRMPMWPDLKTHLKMRQDFPIGHRRINAFPRSYSGAVRPSRIRRLGTAFSPYGIGRTSTRHHQSASKLVDRESAVTDCDAPSASNGMHSSMPSRRSTRSRRAVRGGRRLSGMGAPAAVTPKCLHSARLRLAACARARAPEDRQSVHGNIERLCHLRNVYRRGIRHRQRRAQFRAPRRSSPRRSALSVCQGKSDSDLAAGKTTEELLSLFNELYSDVRADRATELRTAAISDRQAAAPGSTGTGRA